MRNVITSNSYAVVPFHIGEARFAAEGQALGGSWPVNWPVRAVDAAGKPVRVAGSLPPLFGSYRPDLFDAAAGERTADPSGQGLAPHVDLWLAETQSSIEEARAIHAGLPQDGKPFWLSFTLKDEDIVRRAAPALRANRWPTAAEAAAELGVRRCCSIAASPK